MFSPATLLRGENKSAVYCTQKKWFHKQRFNKSLDYFSCKTGTLLTSGKLCKLTIKFKGQSLLKSSVVTNRKLIRKVSRQDFLPKGILYIRPCRR